MTVAPLATSSIRVAQLTAEIDPDEEPRIPWELTPAPGAIAIQLRTTLRRISIGAGLARKTGLLEAVRALPGFPGLVTSPVGGTFVIGGPAWVGICAIAVPPAEVAVAPLDWTMAEMRRWFEAALEPLGLRPGFGRIEGAWCPGFSDIGVAGRKLVGLGFRVTRERVVVRGMINVQPIAGADFSLLAACHRLISVEIVPAASISLGEALGEPGWSAEQSIQHLATITA
ncbi:MAG: hypothetical protein NVS3B18_04590 [Candidatus Dormibacteria bacterium]